MRQLYLIKTATTSNSEIGMEYKMIYENVDMRKTFCKKNKESIINPISLINAVQQVGAQIKGDRVIMKNGKMSYDFSKLISVQCK